MQRHHFANKCPYCQSYGFPSSHVWMWELNCKEGWGMKNWCILTVVLQKTLESPLDSKEIKSVNPKGNQPWIFPGRTDSKAEASVLWLSNANNQFIRKDLDAGKDWGQEEKGAAEDEMVGWHDRLNGHEIECSLRDSEGQGSLVCCCPWDWKFWTQFSDWTTTRMWKLNRRNKKNYLEAKENGNRHLDPRGCCKTNSEREVLEINENIKKLKDLKKRTLLYTSRNEKKDKLSSKLAGGMK